MNSNSKILITRLTAVGDVIRTTPILYSLKQQYPDIFIGWVAEDKTADILIGNPFIDKLHIIPKQSWKKRGFSLKNIFEFFEIIKEIRKENYDIAIDIQELFKSGIITFLSGAKRRIGHAGTREFAHVFVNEKLPAHDLFDPEKFIIERYLESAVYLGASASEIKFSLPPVKEETKLYINELIQDLNPDKKNIVFSPATIWASKHWKEEYWAELADKLSDNFNIIFTGTEKDNILIQRIIQKTDKKEFKNIAGKTNLFELIEVFNRADFIIAPDTGPAHIANAAEKPSIIMIFGSTGYKRTPPYGEKHKALSTELACQPCFKRNCPRSDNFMECMQKITPQMVIEAINSKNK